MKRNIIIGIALICAILVLGFVGVSWCKYGFRDVYEIHVYHPDNWQCHESTAQIITNNTLEEQYYISDIKYFESNNTLLLTSHNQKDCVIGVLGIFMIIIPVFISAMILFEIKKR